MRGDFKNQLNLASRRLQSAVARIEAIGEIDGETEREARLFNLERAAWAMIEMANAWVFEWRLGIPRKETDAFDLLQQKGVIDLPTARRYKQLCEFRLLSSREADRVDSKYLGGDLTAELALFRHWNREALHFEAPTS